MRCDYNFVILAVFGAIVLIVGSVTGARYQTFRAVTCEKTVVCPQTSTYADSNICWQIKDPNGLVSIALPEPSSGTFETNMACWTDGLNVTNVDPYTVLYWSIVSLIIVGLLILAVILFFWRPSENQEETKEEFINNNCVCCTALSSLIILILCFIVVIMVIYGSFDSGYQPLTCKKYQLHPTAKYARIETYVDSVLWNDSFGNSGTTTIYKNTYQPSVLPAPCWIKNDVVFVDPKKIYQVVSIVTAILVLFLLAFILSAYVRCIKPCKLVWIRRIYEYGPYNEQTQRFDIQLKPQVEGIPKEDHKEETMPSQEGIPNV